jgi:hypothetical protein
VLPHSTNALKLDFCHDLPLLFNETDGLDYWRVGTPYV